MQQCKKILNKDIAEEANQQEFRNVETVAVQVASGSASVSQPGVDGVAQPVLGTNKEDEDHSGDEDVEVLKVEAITTSTNAADDYAHRGAQLGNFTFYMYRMHVRRIPKPKPGKAVAGTIFLFESHYALSKTQVQEVVLHTLSVPTIDGFQCPTVEQDAEQNALFESHLVYSLEVHGSHDVRQSHQLQKPSVQRRVPTKRRRLRFAISRICVRCSAHPQAIHIPACVETSLE